MKEDGFDGGPYGASPGMRSLRDAADRASRPSPLVTGRAVNGRDLVNAVERGLAVADSCDAGGAGCPPAPAAHAVLTAHEAELGEMLEQLRGLNLRLHLEMAKVLGPSPALQRLRTFEATTARDMPLVDRLQAMNGALRELLAIAEDGVACVERLV